MLALIFLYSRLRNFLIFPPWQNNSQSATKDSFYLIQLIQQTANIVHTLDKKSFNLRTPLVESCTRYWYENLIRTIIKGKWTVHVSFVRPIPLIYWHLKQWTLQLQRSLSVADNDIILLVVGYIYSPLSQQ